MLVAHQLVKRFRNGGETVTAVDGLSMSVPPGTVYGLLGANGAGKTTTLRMILGLVPPNEGYAEVDGIRTEADPMAAKSRIGFVSATDGVYPWLTVREMLLYFADLYLVPLQQAEARLDELVELMDIRDLLDRRAGMLSTGQKQRVTLVRGLIHDPPVMLLDEPTRGLDVVGVKTIFHYITELRRRGKSVVLCTHRLDEAQRLCDRFGILDHGRLRYSGSMDDLRSETGQDNLVEMFFELLN
ncbi:MAG: ATP-binding cassette domain-containing protein [Planctomycetota bacterium]